MSAAWVFYTILVGVLVMVAANALASAAQRLGKPTRFVWSSAMLVLVAFAVMGGIRTDDAPVALSTMAVAGGKTVALVSHGPSLVERAREAWSVLAGLEQRAADAVLGLLPGSSPEAFIIFWLVSSFSVAVLMLVVHAAMMRQRAKWPHAELHGADVRLTHDIGPAVIGLATPEIVVPSWLLGRSSEEQQLALRHERQHVAARDHLLLAFGWSVVALMPWHPAAWWMLARMRLAIELDCDARVLRGGVAPRSYGQMLIDIADHCSGQRALALALADHTSHLERRLLAMKTSRSRFGRTRATMLGAAGALALLIACESKMPTSAEIQNADVATLEKKATAAALMSKDSLARTEYMVDGKKVLAKDAYALKSDQVATMNIRKTAEGNRIVITTRGAARAGSEGDASQFKVRSDTVVLKPDMVLSHSKTRFDGIYLINGVRASEADFQRLTPDRIESVEVVKGPSAAQMYSDPAAVNGVISITTKK